MYLRIKPKAENSQHSEISFTRVFRHQLKKVKLENLFQLGFAVEVPADHLSKGGHKKLMLLGAL